MRKAYQIKMLSIMVGVLLLSSCQKEFTIMVVPNNASMGRVIGSGMYKKGIVLKLKALPMTGYRFEQWDDGITDNPRIIIVKGNATYTAVFVDEGDNDYQDAFSVSETQKVYFSQGNLQWSATGSHEIIGGDKVTGTWRFAPHQWDTIGVGNENISATYTGWIDLFGWGTSGYDDKSPYMTSTTYTDYGNGENDIAGTNYDWGVYNAIYNPITQTSDAPGTWRTLTKDEWVYLLKTRSTSSNIRFAKAIVNGVNGLVIVPDNWTNKVYELKFTNITGANYTSNTILATDWEDMEIAGCVFLPAAGVRSGTSVLDAGFNGSYWTTMYNSSSIVYCLYFNSIYLYSSISSNICYGFSVRLVRDVQ